MADQILKDKQNKTIGRIRTLSDGRLEIRDPQNLAKGTYNPKTNETRDRQNRVVGKGNLLVTLL